MKKLLIPLILLFVGVGGGVGAGLFLFPPEPAEDSMPEMGDAVCRRYLERIREKSKLFLSLNHEAQTPLPSGDHHSVVRALVGQIGGFAPQYRFPWWIRNGYVEELFAIEAS